MPRQLPSNRSFIHSRYSTISDGSGMFFLVSCCSTLSGNSFILCPSPANVSYCASLSSVPQDLPMCPCPAMAVMFPSSYSFIQRSCPATASYHTCCSYTYMLASSLPVQHYPATASVPSSHCDSCSCSFMLRHVSHGSTLSSNNLILCLF